MMDSNGPVHDECSLTVIIWTACVHFKYALIQPVQNMDANDPRSSTRLTDDQT